MSGVPAFVLRRRPPLGEGDFDIVRGLSCAVCVFGAGRAGRAFFCRAQFDGGTGRFRYRLHGLRLRYAGCRGICHLCVHGLRLQRDRGRGIRLRIPSMPPFVIRLSALWVAQHIMRFAHLLKDSIGFFAWLTLWLLVRVPSQSECSVLLVQCLGARIVLKPQNCVIVRSSVVTVCIEPRHVLLALSHPELSPENCTSPIQ